MIDDGGATPTVGQTYNLNCSVSGGSVSSYQWRKDGAVLQGQTTEVLLFSPITLSDAGRYSCEISVTAVSETFTAIQNQNVIIQSELVSFHAWLLLIAITYIVLCSSISNFSKHRKQSS